MDLDPRVVNFLKSKRKKRYEDDEIDPSLMGALAQSFSQVGTLGGQHSDASPVEKYANILSRKRQQDIEREDIDQSEYNKLYAKSLQDTIDKEERSKALGLKNQMMKSAMEKKEKKEDRDYELRKKMADLQERRLGAYEGYLKSKKEEPKEQKRTQEQERAQKALGRAFTASLNLERELSNVGNIKKNQGFLEKAATAILPAAINPYSSGALLKNAVSQAAGEQGILEDPETKLTQGRYVQGKGTVEPGIYSPSFGTFKDVHEKTRIENAGKIHNYIEEYKRKYDPNFEPPKEIKDMLKKYYKPVEEIQYGDKQSEWKTGKGGVRYRKLPDGTVEVE